MSKPDSDSLVTTIKTVSKDIMKHKVLSFFPDKELAKISLTNKQFYENSKSARGVTFPIIIPKSIIDKNNSEESIIKFLKSFGDSKDPSKNSVKKLSLKEIHAFVTDDTIKHIAELFPNLTEIDLSHCHQVSDGFLYLKNMPQLQSFSLAYCDVTDEEISFLKDMPKLQSLNLAYCKLITNIAFLENMHDLKNLNLSNCNKITNLDFLKDKNQLQNLNISNIKITNLTFLKGKDQLQKLNLSNCNLIDNGDFVFLEDMNKLQDLNLSDTPISNTGLVFLKDKQLQSLDLSYTKITNAGLGSLKKMSQLKSLNLSSNSINNAGLVHLKGMSELQSFNIAFTRVSDASLAPYVKNMPRLQKLEVNIVGSKCSMILSPSEIIEFMSKNGVKPSPNQVDTKMQSDIEKPSQKISSKRKNFFHDSGQEKEYEEISKKKKMDNVASLSEVAKPSAQNIRESSAQTLEENVKGSDIYR